MDYLSNPIDVRKFDEYFRSVRKLEGMTLVAFTQKEARWTAFYQDAEVSVTFHGEVQRTLSRMERGVT